MRPPAEGLGIVLVCNRDGAVEQVVRDDFGLSARVRPGSNLRDLVDPGARDKIAAFLAELLARQAACDWEITVPLDGALLPLNFAGARTQSGYVVMATRLRNGQIRLDEELMRINNEQTNILRTTTKLQTLAVGKRAEKDENAFEELTRLNNEMVNLQRELAKKNAELQRYYAAAEEEQKIATHLMSQLVRIDLLQDPLLAYWIQPASNLSGDLIAAARTPGGVLHLLLADGTGHGLAASLNVLPMVDPFYAMTAKGIGIGAIAGEINGKIKRWLPVGRFVAAALIAYDPRERLIEVWCGGVPPPFLLDGGGSMVHEFPSMHMAMGILAPEEFDAQTESRQFDGPGQLIVCSDGVTEAEGPGRTPFGSERLVQALRGAPASERIGRLKDALMQHLAGRPAHDDISVAIVECGS